MLFIALPLNPMCIALGDLNLSSKKFRSDTALNVNSSRIFNIHAEWRLLIYASGPLIYMDNDNQRVRDLTVVVKYTSLQCFISVQFLA